MQLEPVPRDAPAGEAMLKVRIPAGHASDVPAKPKFPKVMTTFSLVPA
jgi:hypothetical protein